MPSALDLLEGDSIDASNRYTRVARAPLGVLVRPLSGAVIRR
jgi:hypothetical protein